MSKPLSIGQIWLLGHAVLHNGLLYIGISTWLCPEPVGMNAVRGLEKRGLIELTRTSGIFSVTVAGRERYAANKGQLDKAIADKRLLELSRDEEANA